jgi:hypothetical protein
VEKALREVTAAAGLEPYDEELPVYGSWFKRIFVRTREIATLPEVQDRLEKIERAVNIAKIETPQAKVDSDLSRAVVNLEKALSKHDSGIISVGSLFVVKTTTRGRSNLTVMNLTYEQMEIVKSNPSAVSARVNTTGTGLGRPCCYPLGGKRHVRAKTQAFLVRIDYHPLSAFANDPTHA